MAAPQTTPNKGNGSVIDETIAQAAQSLYQKDSFQENLERTEKPVQDNILSYPSDLFRVPEHRFGIRLDIYDASGDALTEQRKRIDRSFGFGELANSTAANARESRNRLLQEGNANITAEASAVLNTLASGAASGLAAGAAGLKSITDFISTTEETFDPSGRQSQVEAIVGVKSPQNKVASVYLYMPGNLSFSSDFDYEDADMSNIDFIRGIQGAAGFGNPEAQADIMRKMGVGFVTQSSLAESLGGKDFFGNFVKIQQRQVENPFLVHLFKGVQRRTFTFDWEMVPRSEKEAFNVYSIVNTLRRYAYPHRNTSGRYLDFPAEFDVTFIYKHEKMSEAIAIPKIKKCAIKSIKVDYGENIFTAHKPMSNGMVMPTKVKLNVQLSELSILARQEIEEGY